MILPVVMGESLAEVTVATSLMASPVVRAPAGLISRVVVVTPALGPI